MKIVTRAEAKRRGLKRYFTGKPCLHGHMVERITSNYACIVCHAQFAREWRRENPERVAQYASESREHTAARSRQWYLRNKELVLERGRERVRQNRARVNAKNRARRARNVKRARLLAFARYWSNPGEKRKYAREYSAKKNAAVKALRLIGIRCERGVALSALTQLGIMV